MEFEWASENIGHIAEHGLTPAQVEQVFSHDPVYLGFEYVAGEPRWSFVGHTDELKFMIVIITERHDRNRVVSAFPAGRPMIRRYIREKGEQS